MHEALASGTDRDWGYRRLNTYAVAASERRPRAGRDRTPGPRWLGGATVTVRQLGDRSSTAQVHPRAFTEALVEMACARGARLHIDTVIGLRSSPDGSRVSGVELESGPLTADAIVIAMGPWSLLAAEWLSLPATYGLKGHSIVLRPPMRIDADALFSEYEDAHGETHSPEIYPRADGTVYACGLSGFDALPVDPAAVEVENGAGDRLERMVLGIAPALAGAERVAVQACYRPILVDALPMLGRVPGHEGAYVATGHNCWGMLNAPASGLAMAELITEGEARVVDLAAFDPARPGLRTARPTHMQ